MSTREEFIEIPVFDDGMPFSVVMAGVSYCDGSYRIHRPKSAVLCVEYVISGSGTVKTRGKTFYPSQGDCYMLLPGENHLYFSDDDDPWVKIWINARGSMIEPLIDAYSLRDSTLIHCNGRPYIEKIHAILSDKSLTPKESADKSAIVFHELLQFLSGKSGATSEPADVIKDYIDKNIYSSISIDELARLIYKSPAQTIRIFKKRFNMTPYDYYMESRMKKAVQMLESTSYSVKEIAFRLGFGDEHYFSGIFKKKTGKKPTDYR